MPATQHLLIISLTVSSLPAQIISLTHAIQTCPEGRQPLWRSLDALLHIIFRCIEAVVPGSSDLIITQTQIRGFRERNGRKARITEQAVALPNTRSTL